MKVHLHWYVMVDFRNTSDSSLSLSPSYPALARSRDIFHIQGKVILANAPRSQLTGQGYHMLRCLILDGHLRLDCDDDHIQAVGPSSLHLRMRHFLYVKYTN